MRTITLKLPEPLHALLAAAARRTGRTRSALIRDAMLAYFDGQKARRGGSVLDLVENLAGCLDGPVDLSSAKKHMSGFGR